MITIIAILVITELLAFLCYDSFRNRGNLSGRLAVRLAAGITGTVLILLEFLAGGECTVDGLMTDMVVVTELLLMYPCSFEKSSLALRTVLSACGLALCCLLGFSILPFGLSLFRSQRQVLTYMLVLTVFGVYLSANSWRRFRGIRLFFRNSAVWYGIEDYARFLYSSAFLCLAAFSACSVSVPGNAGIAVRVACIVLYMALYALLYLRALTGRTFVVGPRTEDRIKDIIKGNLRTSFIDKAEEDRRMNTLYRKVMFLMNEKKPYLDPSFCMNDLAEQVYSNKLYVSKTINIL